MQQRNFSPFLMFDHAFVEPPAGFPDHPHYGFSTVTYVIEGMIAHEDFTGSRGLLHKGDLQFMTAGKGIVHSEMPVATKDGKVGQGIQLWVDLPAEMKNCDPVYRDLKRGEIPIVKPDDKVTVKVISGESYGVKSVQDLAMVAVDYYDYEIAPGGEFVQPFTPSYNVFLYVIEGSLEVQGKTANQFGVIFFNRNSGDAVVGKVPETQSGNTRFILIGGEPLNQPIVQHGPFVATTREKIYDTFMNFQTGENGFERARGWHSEIGSGVTEDNVQEKLHLEKNDEV